MLFYVICAYPLSVWAIYDKLSSSSSFGFDFINVIFISRCVYACYFVVSVL